MRKGRDRNPIHQAGEERKVFLGAGIQERQSEGPHPQVPGDEMVAHPRETSGCVGSAHPSFQMGSSGPWPGEVPLHLVPNGATIC